jgi:hypothetical protein
MDLGERTLARLQSGVELWMLEGGSRVEDLQP